MILMKLHLYRHYSCYSVKDCACFENLGCCIHIGTATMPTALYNQILELLGKENVLEVKLSDNELNQFDRHIINKINSWESTLPVISQAIEEDKKVLLVCNRVQSAQLVFDQIKEKYPNIPSMLLHSRFKRGARGKMERLLIGKDENGKVTRQFNTSEKACVVVSTQVIEVSLDISLI